MASSAANAAGWGWKQCTVSAGGHRNPRRQLGHPMWKFPWEKQESTKPQDIQEEAKPLRAEPPLLLPPPCFFLGRMGTLLAAMIKFPLPGAGSSCAQASSRTRCFAISPATGRRRDELCNHFKVTLGANFSGTVLVGLGLSKESSLELESPVL